MIPLLVSLIGIEVIKRVIKAREDAIFLIQDVAENAIFLAWILYDSGELEETKTAIELLDKTAKAYLYVCGLPLIVARSKDEILQYQHLREFFSQFPSAREHLQLAEAGNIYYINKIDKELLDNIEKLYPSFQMTEEQKEEIQFNASEFVKWLNDQLKIILDQLGNDPLQFIEYLCQRLSQTVYPDFLYNLPSWLVWLLNPFIDIDWVIIKTIITLKYALSHVRLSSLAEEIPSPYIPKMRVNLFDEDELLATTEVQEEGKIEIETVTDDPTLSDLYLNLHGLILRIPIVEIAKKLKLYVETTDTWIGGLETEWVRIEMFTMPDLSRIFIIGFEDLKGQPDKDFDYDDVLIYVFETEDKLIAKVYGTFGVYDNYLYIKGLDEPIYCPPRNIDWRKDKIPPDDYLCAVIEFDKETLTLINVE